MGTSQKSSALQAGWLWGECVENVIVPDPRNNEARRLTCIHCWESKEHQDNEIEEILVTCSWKTGKYAICKCARINKKCLDFCSCTRKCSNVKCFVCLRKLTFKYLCYILMKKVVILHGVYLFYLHKLLKCLAQSLDNYSLICILFR